jgi:hypothetical protein
MLDFGIAPCTCSDIKNKTSWLVVHKLKRHLLPRVKFSNKEKTENFALQINRCEPKVNGVIGLMDGHACN